MQIQKTNYLLWIFQIRRQNYLGISGVPNEITTLSISLNCPMPMHLRQFNELSITSWLCRRIVQHCHIYTLIIQKKKESQKIIDLIWCKNKFHFKNCQSSELNMRWRSMWVIMAMKCGSHLVVNFRMFSKLYTKKIYDFSKNCNQWKRWIIHSVKVYECTGPTRELFYWRNSIQNSHVYLVGI